MKHLKRYLPPLTSIVAFEAAARQGSFTAAAEELNVSREAVSRQIRALESHLGIKLFDRDANRALMLHQGTKFFGTVSPNLWAIATAAQNIAGETVLENRPLVDAQLVADNDELPVLLIVDDTPENIHHLHGLLSDSYRVIPYTSGREALSYLRGRRLI